MVPFSIQIIQLVKYCIALIFQSVVIFMCVVRFIFIVINIQKSNYMTESVIKNSGELIMWNSNFSVCPSDCASSVK